MNKVLNRKMFKAPTYEHRSTGIASGLEYRPGYKVGGRVGYQDGNLVSLEDMIAQTGLQSPLSLEEAVEQQEGIYAAMPKIDYGQGTTRGDVVQEGLLRTLDEQRAIRPARTLGTPNLGASLVYNFMTADKNAKTRNAELAMMASAEEKQDYKDIIAGAKEETRFQTERTDALNMHQKELYANFLDSGLDRAQALKVAELNAIPETQKMIEFYMSEAGGGMSADDARAEANKTRDNMMDAYIAALKIAGQQEEFAEEPKTIEQIIIDTNELYADFLKQFDEGSQQPAPDPEAIIPELPVPNADDSFQGIVNPDNQTVG